MKQLQRLSMAAVLILVIAMSVPAGDIPIPGALPPTSASTTASGEIPIPGDIPIGVTADGDYVLLDDVALNLLQILLSVF